MTSEPTAADYKLGFQHLCSELAVLTARYMIRLACIEGRQPTPQQEAELARANAVLARLTPQYLDLLDRLDEEEEAQEDVS